MLSYFGNISYVKSQPVIAIGGNRSNTVTPNLRPSCQNRSCCVKKNLQHMSPICETVQKQV